MLGCAGLKAPGNLVVDRKPGGRFIGQIGFSRQGSSVSGQASAIGIGLKCFCIGVAKVLQKIPVVIDVVVDFIACQKNLFFKLVPVGVARKRIGIQLAIWVRQKKTGGRQGCVNAHLRIFLVVQIKIHQGVIADLPVQGGRNHVTFFFRGFCLAISGAGQPNQAVG